MHRKIIFVVFPTEVRFNKIDLTKERVKQRVKDNKKKKIVINRP